jgi:hypothetical protein
VATSRQDHLDHAPNPLRAQLHQNIDQGSRRIQIQNQTKRETTTAQDVRIHQKWGTPQMQSHKLNELSIMLPVVKKTNIHVAGEYAVRFATEKWAPHM